MNRGNTTPKPKGSLACHWKGDAATYGAKHNWLYKQVGKAVRCENPDCIYPRRNTKGVLISSPSRYEWANISGEYKRDKRDYVQLCPSCHRRYDGGFDPKLILFLHNLAV